VTHHDVAARDAPLAQLGESLAPLRLRDAAALEAMRRSLHDRGQLAPLCAFVHDGALELLDGFKRLAAARKLGWSTLRVQVSDLDVVAATASIVEMHQGLAITALEQGWIVRALHRQHGLSFGEIASLLGRDKTWVWRRCLLVEGLCAEVQAEVRLGLLSPRAALCLASLPRGNDQLAAARVVSACGLTVRQTSLLVDQLTEVPAEERSALLARWLQGPPLRGGNGSRKTQPPRSHTDALVVTIATLRRSATALLTQLRATPLQVLPPDAAQLLRASLLELRAPLGALHEHLRGLEDDDAIKDVA
jgi:ParB-like chromosome segregation protein Spo0J